MGRHGSYGESMNLNVYGVYLPRGGARLAERCRHYDVDPKLPLLLVMACDEGPHQLAAAVAAWGERPLTVDKTGTFKDVTLIYTGSITDFARQYPRRLLAKTATGLPPARDADGIRRIVWADLSDAGTVDVGDPRARIAS